MPKGPEAFKTISEVADALDLPQHVLRFWETRFRQIKPMKRGGGRRYYRPEDVALLAGIRQLLYGEGYTIRGVQRILKEQGQPYVAALGRGEAVVPQAVVDAEAEDADAADAGGPVMAATPPSPEVAPAEPGPAPPAPAAPPALGPEDARRLQAVLAELAELKRLLDRAR